MNFSMKMGKRRGLASVDERRTHLSVIFRSLEVGPSLISMITLGRYMDSDLVPKRLSRLDSRTTRDFTA